MASQIAGALLIGLGALAIAFNAYVWWRRGITSRPISGFPVIGGVLAARASSATQTKTTTSSRTWRITPSENRAFDC